MGPESIKSGNEPVTFVEGESMSGLVCEVEGEVYPEEAKEIEYSLGDKVVMIFLLAILLLYLLLLLFISFFLSSFLCLSV